MGSNALIKKLCFMYYLSWLLPVLFFSRSAGQDVPFKAVNLGGWLVAEGGMTPFLFDGITNKDLLDGTHVSLRSTKLNNFLAAENGGGAGLVADTTTISGWETFRLWRINETTFNLRVFNKQFVGLKDQSQDGNIVAISTTPGHAETFQIVRNENDPYRIRLRTSNGLFLQAQNGSSVTADFGESADWGDQNPSVFQLFILYTLLGEYQVTNGYGPDRAPQVMKEH
ncbi:hypothetical protein M9H77_31900 [Catharanthus roseus]|uniref:Uncharacterized protein n=1 Tax=Catharanthus roseus TaxID=4058 RepID=A0ACC0A5L2_CATRO|nr:hypothetical protein M9H77_31900 [Catharanthus roseus]